MSCHYTIVVAGRLVLALAFTVVASAGAGERLSGPVPARVIEVIDGDTLVVRARIWLGQNLTTRVRLSGVDTPERRGRCVSERALAKRARLFVAARVGDREVVLKDIRFGKYAGRVVARVLAPNGRDLAEALIAAGLGHAYAGGARPDWCLVHTGAPAQ